MTGFVVKKEPERQLLHPAPYALCVEQEESKGKGRGQQVLLSKFSGLRPMESMCPYNEMQIGTMHLGELQTQ